MGGSCEKNLDSVLPAVNRISMMEGREARSRIHTVNSEGENDTFFAGGVGEDHVEFSLGAIALNRVIGWSMDVPALQGGGLVDTIVFVLESDGGFLGGIGVQSESWTVAPVRPCSNGSGRKVERWCMCK